MSEIPFKRNSSNKMIAGVCGGIGRQFNLDANFVRIAFAALAFTQIGWMLYLGMWLLLPSDDGPTGLESLIRQFNKPGG